MTDTNRPCARRLRAAALLLAALAAAPTSAQEPIFIPPLRIDPTPAPQPPEWPVETGLMQVRTEIRDGVATTAITQTLHNRTAAQQEALWLLPVPAGVLADRFTMTVGGQTMQAEVLDAGNARRIYEEIVRKRRDPGLLEYLGDGLLRARVFPIPANGEVQVAVRYSQLLRPSDGVTSFHFPLRAAWLDGHGPRKLSFVVDAQTQQPIKTVWSPLPELAIARDGDRRLLASAEFDRAQLPQRDLELHFGLADQDFGLSVLTHRRPGEPGYFVAWLAPKRDWPTDTRMVRSVSLVLDTSGSMAGEKIRQARAAVRTFLLSLAPGDRFNVIPFSTDARPFFPEPVPADDEHRKAALAKVDQLEARGGTNIADALGAALRNGMPVVDGGPPMVPITIFLTDGLPTVGTTDVDALLAEVQAANQDRARVFVFGVGDDVNTRLLDTLAQQSRGDRDYVRPGEDIERKTGGLFAKLSGPVMTDLQLRFEGLDVEDLEPRDLPDLFVQGQLTIVGRFRGDGHRAIRLRGTVGDAAREYVFEASFPTQQPAHDWLPALWAQRRVATLMEAIRRQGQQPELVAEVTRLGKEHGIVTPFTSHLIVEEGLMVAQRAGVQPGVIRLGQGDEDRLRGEWRRAGLAAPPGAADLAEVVAEAKGEADAAGRTFFADAETGAAAVDRSVQLLRLARSQTARDDGAVALLHRRLAGRNLHLVQGVWVDGALTEGQLASPRRIAAFSDDYFALLNAHPELARLFAFSTRMVLRVGDAAVEITG
ncbi:MAG: VIT domain-containing protein [Planctomycetota bacterium]